MSDPFDTILADALSPPARDPDRAFVARVQAGILVEDRLRAVRRADLRALGLQAVALFAVAGGLILLLRSDAIAGLAGLAPGLTLMGLLCIFALFVALITAESETATKLNAR